MKFEVHKTKNGQFMWRLKAANGNILADSAESYTTKENCIAGMMLVMDTTRQTPWHDLTK